MVTLAEEPEQSPGNRERVVDAAYVARDTVTDGVRYAITGDRKGRIRRGVLYLLTVVGIVTGWTLLAMLAVLLLALTDSVIEFPND